VPDADRSGVTTIRVNASQEKLLLIQWWAHRFNTRKAEGFWTCETQSAALAGLLGNVSSSQFFSGIVV